MPAPLDITDYEQGDFDFTAPLGLLAAYVPQPVTIPSPNYDQHNIDFFKPQSDE